MRFEHFGKVGALAAAMLVLPGLSLAVPSECGASKPTPESYTWNFKSEATKLLTGIQQDAAMLENHAAELQSFKDSPDLSRQADENQLTRVKAEVNDMGAKLCRLETIRRMVSPWQQSAIDKVAPTIRLLADNTDDAIYFVNNNPEQLWRPKYEQYANNLYGEASQLSQQTKQYEEFAKIHSQDMRLERSIGLRANS